MGFPKGLHAHAHGTKPGNLPLAVTFPGQRDGATFEPMGARRARAEQGPVLAVESVEWFPYGCRSPRPRVIEFVTVGGDELELVSEAGQYVIRRTPPDGGPVVETARGVCAEAWRLWRDLTGG